MSREQSLSFQVTTLSLFMAGARNCNHAPWSFVNMLQMSCCQLALVILLARTPDHPFFRFQRSPHLSAHPPCSALGWSVVVAVPPCPAYSGWREGGSWASPHQLPIALALVRHGLTHSIPFSRQWDLSPRFPSSFEAVFTALNRSLSARISSARCLGHALGSGALRLRSERQLDTGSINKLLGGVSFRIIGNSCTQDFTKKNMVHTIHQIRPVQRTCDMP